MCILACLRISETFSISSVKLVYTPCLLMHVDACCMLYYTSINAARKGHPAQTLLDYSKSVTANTSQSVDNVNHQRAVYIVSY